MDSISYLRAVDIGWSAVKNVNAYLSSGASTEANLPYGGFNLAKHVGDSSQQVAANRGYLAAWLQGQQITSDEPLWLNQVHGSEVYLADVDRARGKEINADASYTDQPGIVLAVLVADCLPILMFSADGREVAVIHAGWRGLANGIIAKTVAQFRCRELNAWVGPAIGPCHYEVDQQVKQAFGSATNFIETDNVGRWRFDLAKEAARQLRYSAVSQVVCERICTYCDQRYYSYRRDGKTGRFAALISISNPPSLQCKIAQH
ncbi:MAG: peptidoglycan editing factor PgeF [Pseudomonadales bacterium]|nr:peptidoglycan editing factor PgeF [Pseudomonadales bacterium]